MTNGNLEIYNNLKYSILVKIYFSCNLKTMEREFTYPHGAEKQHKFSLMCGPLTPQKANLSCGIRCCSEESSGAKLINF